MKQAKEQEGIVLSSIPFKDNDRLVTLFTKQGLLKVYMRGAARPKNKLFGLSEPLTHLLFSFYESKGDFQSFIEGKCLHPFLNLRESYAHLMAAFEMIRCILKSQGSEEGTSQLFELFKRLLIHLMDFETPLTAVSFFYFKILLHEGQLHLSNKCSVCQKKEDPLFFYHADYFCKMCSKNTLFPWTQDELYLALKLIQVKTFDELKLLTLKESFYDKTKKLFSALNEVVL